MIAFLMIAGLGVLALLSRLAALTRMTIPLLYTVSMLTVFHGWYRAHTVLADRILFRSCRAGGAVLAAFADPALSAILLCRHGMTLPLWSISPTAFAKHGRTAKTPSAQRVCGAESAKAHQLPDDAVAHLDRAHQHQHIEDQFAYIVPRWWLPPAYHRPRWRAGTKQRQRRSHKPIR